MAFDIGIFYNWCIATINRGCSYSQHYRYAGYVSTHYGEPDYYNPKGESYDCSSFVSFGLWAGGIGAYDAHQYAPACDWLIEKLPLYGWTYHPITDAKKPGDILLKTTHVEVYYGDGKEMGAHSTEGGVNIRNYVGNSNYDFFYRYESQPTPEPEPVPPTETKEKMPIWMYPIFRWR